LQTNHEEILQELYSLRDAITHLDKTSAYPSWAQVVAGGNRDPLYPMFNNRRQAKEVNCVRVSTKPSDVDGKNEDKDTFRRYLLPRLVVAHI
jgi:hypothetical protein